MNLADWFRGWWVVARMNRYEEAERRTEEVADTAREINRRLEPYERETDPFRALMIDLYNRRNEVIHQDRAR